MPSGIELSGAFDTLGLAVIACEVAYLVVVEVLDVLFVFPSFL
jgi:hypothetical protein